MICRRCSGRVFIDREFSNEYEWETFCLICGERRFIPVRSPLGRAITKWLEDNG
jgi:hypothetical protein